jgi:hypothetical protein
VIHPRDTLRDLEAQAHTERAAIQNVTDRMNAPVDSARPSSAKGTMRRCRWRVAWSSSGTPSGCRARTMWLAHGRPPYFLLHFEESRAGAVVDQAGCGVATSFDDFLERYLSDPRGVARVRLP